MSICLFVCLLLSHTKHPCMYFIAVLLDCYTMDTVRGSVFQFHLSPTCVREHLPVSFANWWQLRCNCGYSLDYLTSSYRMIGCLWMSQIYSFFACQLYLMNLLKKEWKFCLRLEIVASALNERLDEFCSKTWLFSFVNIPLIKAQKTIYSS